MINETTFRVIAVLAGGLMLVVGYFASLEERTADAGHGRWLWLLGHTLPAFVGVTAIATGFPRVSAVLFGVAVLVSIALFYMRAGVPKAWEIVTLGTLGALGSTNVICAASLHYLGQSFPGAP